MQLFLLVALTMIAFAANSILNRIGVADYGMDPMAFAVVRVVAGAVMLWVLVLLRPAARPTVFAMKHVAGAAALSIYMIGFSLAYINLGAGLGALILFGVLQVVIFGWAVYEGQSVPPARWLGGLIALSGLCVLLWPSGQASVPINGTLAMIAAAIGWAAYTLLGRGSSDPLGASACNFLLCVPLVGLALAASGIGPVPIMGIITAVIAGAVTSGLGYALWYRVLIDLPTTVAGLAQLSVPVIAVAAGVLLLGEPISMRLLIAGLLVLGGIAVSLTVRR